MQMKIEGEVGENRRGGPQITETEMQEWLDGRLENYLKYKTLMLVKIDLADVNENGR